ncbi:hypothetical protein CPB97_006123 [Podila verticillata]|nr:hypothetical protein CPB97_006123 [Podila verticillata]
MKTKCIKKEARIDLRLQTDALSVVVHLHSVVVLSIYRTFCKIGDKDPIQRDELLWMIVLPFQRRAKTELRRAKINDNATKHMPRNTGNLCAPGPNEYYDTMKYVWHSPPHIVVTMDNFTFGRYVAATTRPRDPGPSTSGRCTGRKHSARTARR